nr:MAG TPA: hypothetical protein [Microviridae sp.]
MRSSRLLSPFLVSSLVLVLETFWVLVLMPLVFITI